MALISKPSCSFCGKDQKSVDKLIVGQNDVFICNECIYVCNQVLIPSSNNTGKPHFEIVEHQMFCAILQNFDESTISDMLVWLDDNEIGVWTRSAGVYTSSFKIIFENESDIVAFKLRWI